MQRRAAAIYAAFFIVVAAGAYAMIGVAEEPAVSIQNPDRTLSSGDRFTVDGRTYSVSSLSEGSAKLVWVEEGVRFTETLEAQPYEGSWPPGDGSGPFLAADGGPTATINDTEYRVLTEPSPDPNAFALVETRSLPGNATTVTENNVTYVVVEEDGERTLVTREEFLRDTTSPPEVRVFAVAESLAYGNRTVDVAEVTNTSVTLEWTGSRENTVSVSGGDNVTLNGRTFVAHFPDASTLELSRDVAAYQRQLRVVDTYHERINGLWGVSLLSGLAAVALLAIAYLPSRY